MLRNANVLMGFRLRARDGDIGRVRDLYFEDNVWTVRYLVADTGFWLPKKQVLISPFALGQALDPDRVIEVSLDKQQIEESPLAEEDKPVSRQMEAQFYQHYGWPYYWQGPYLWGPGPYPGDYVAPSVQQSPDDLPPPRPDNPHLRSVTEVRGYGIRAIDDEFGHIEDFVIDDRDWVIRYLIVDTQNWWPSKHVLLPPQWLSDIDWQQSRVRVNLHRETIKRAPAHTDGTPITREYETKLFDFYQREPYWRSESQPLVRRSDWSDGSDRSD